MLILFVPSLNLDAHSHSSQTPVFSLSCLRSQLLKILFLGLFCPEILLQIFGTRKIKHSLLWIRKWPKSTGLSTLSLVCFTGVGIPWVDSFHVVPQMLLHTGLHDCHPLGSREIIWYFWSSYAICSLLVVKSPEPAPIDLAVFHWESNRDLWWLGNTIALSCWGNVIQSFLLAKIASHTAAGTVLMCVHEWC